MQEWIELYNSNNSEVDLSDWQIQDKEGTATTYFIPKNTKILTNGFLLLKRPDTKIMLNNEGDSINLLTPDKKVINSITFTKAPLGQSYSKTNSDKWQWSTTPTPVSANIITAIQTKTAVKTLPKDKKSDNNKIELAAADLNESLNTNQDKTSINPWFLFFTALIVTIISATTVLLIKLKLKKNVRT
ncbi:MAG: lamin tail domain-containing protein [Candidatus Staskawiczbacteria bacterium]|nr:lamin tail domain-containing protein [Candidatus Staskawiczbacteria bacterium]